MGYYNNDIIENIRNKGDIVTIINEFISIKKRGRNFIALCPFHSEKTPSFVISPEKQIYSCFGCGESGDLFSFLMKYKGMTFSETVVYLGEKLNINTQENKYKNNKKLINKKNKCNILYEIHSFATRYFYKKLYSEIGKNINIYLQKRKISTEILKIFKIGYAPYYNDELIDQLTKLNYKEKDLLESGIFAKNNKNKLYVKFYNRLIFPIENLSGKIIAFGGRSIDNNIEPKYLNSQETEIFKKKNNLFGINNSLLEIKKKNKVIVVEGYIDVIKCWQNGIKNVVASLGTAFTEEQGKLLSRYCNEIIIVFDNDNAGKNASLKALNILKDFKIDIKIVTLEGAKDPDEFLDNFGLNKFLEQIRNAKTGFRYLLDYFKNIYNYKLPEEKIKCIRQVLPYIMSIEDDLLKNEYLKILSSEMNLEKEDLNKIVYGKNIKKIITNYNVVKNKTTNNLKNKINDSISNSQLIVLRIFLNYFEYSDLFTKEILKSFTNCKINRILSFILSLKKNERKIDIILLKLQNEKDLTSFLGSLVIKSDKTYPNISREEFNSYLLFLRKNFLKEKSKKILFEIELAEKNKNINSIENLKEKYMICNKKITNIVKKIKEINRCLE